MHRTHILACACADLCLCVHAMVDYTYIMYTCVVSDHPCFSAHTQPPLLSLCTVICHCWWRASIGVMGERGGVRGGR